MAAEANIVVYCAQLAIENSVINRAIHDNVRDPAPAVLMFNKACSYSSLNADVGLDPGITLPGWYAVYPVRLPSWCS